MSFTMSKIISIARVMLRVSLPGACGASQDEIMQGFLYFE